MRRTHVAVPGAGRWIVALGAVSALGVASAPAHDHARAAVAAPRLALRVPIHGTASRAPKLGGVVFGGLTPQRFPVIVRVSRDLRQVVQTAAGIQLHCATSGGTVDVPDGYQRLRLSRSGRFGASFGPQPVDTGDPAITATVQGSVAGKVNAKHTSASGQWRLTITTTTVATGATDACDSGVVTWKAKQ
jgi:hypothetical protein